MSGSDSCFDSFVANSAAHIADTPMAGTARSALSTPGSQQPDSPQQPAAKSVQSAAASNALAPPEPAHTAAHCDIKPSNGANRSPRSPSPTSLFEEHSGLRPIAAESEAHEEGWATVPPHRLPAQVQLCLRHAYGASASAELIVQKAPPPYRLPSDVRAMSEAEYGVWVEQVESAWYARLRTMPPWNRHPTLAEGGTAHGSKSRADASRPQRGAAASGSSAPPPRPSRQPSPGLATVDAPTAYSTQIPTTVYGAYQPGGAYGPTAAYGPYGAQGYYPQQPTVGPMQPVVIGPAQPSPMGPVHPVMVGPMQQVVTGPMPAAWPFPAAHRPVPLPVMMPVPPMMGAVGNPYAVGGGAFYYSGGVGVGGGFAFGGRARGGHRRGYGQGQQSEYNGR